jgi:hypothetical protein
VEVVLPETGGESVDGVESVEVVLPEALPTCLSGRSKLVPTTAFETIGTISYRCEEFHCGDWSFTLRKAGEGPVSIVWSSLQLVHLGTHRMLCGELC